MLELLELTSFLPKLLRRKNELIHARLQSTKSRLSNLFDQIIPLQTNMNKFEQDHASTFNIFGLLRYGHYETRLHTPFLCSLLDPKGHHQLGSRFLKVFLSELFDDKVDFDNLKSFQLIEELSVGPYGQIDIFITFQYMNNHYCVAIENKINAVDQPDQLERYYKFMSEHYPSATRKLVYLTKSGKYPSEYSLKNELLNQYMKDDILYLKSYKTDIKNWIDYLLKEPTPEVVKHTLEQYKQTIKAFQHD